MPMYNSLEYSKNYRKTIGSLYNYYRVKLTDDNIPADNVFNNIRVVNSETFKYKNKIVGKTYDTAADDAGYGANKKGTQTIELAIPLKYLSNFFRSLEMPLINCKIKLNLTWKKECVLSNQSGNAVFIINNTTLYVPVVTLSKEDNKDFIEQQNKGFQRYIYWNEYKTKEQTENGNANSVKYINLDSSFQGVNRLFVMAYSRENDDQPTRNERTKYYLPRIDLKKYNVIVDGRNFFDNPIESDIEKYRERKRRRLYYRIFVRL